MRYLFQIRVDELRIAGGILLMVLSVYEIVFTRPGEHHGSPGRIKELGVVPMAVPLLVGPGSIVTAILILDRDGWLIALAALVANLAIAFVVIRSSVVLARVMGPVGTLVVARVLWIFIAAIAVHFVVAGIAELFNLKLAA